MSDKKELTAEDFYKKDNPDNTYEESPIDQWYFGKEDMILFARRFHQAKLREKAMLELTSQSVEDGDRVYTEAQMKERVIKSLLSFAHSGQLPDTFCYTDEEILTGLEKWYNENYGSDE